MTDKPRVEVRDLSTYVQSEIDRVPTSDDGYSECVTVMINAAVASMEAVARELGVTGFQHSVASLNVLAKLRDIEGPLMIINVEDALYPQYNLVEKLQKFLDSDDVVQWLAEQATKRIEERKEENIAPGVMAHWKALAARRKQ